MYEVLQHYSSINSGLTLASLYRFFFRSCIAFNLNSFFLVLIFSRFPPFSSMFMLLVSLAGASLAEGKGVKLFGSRGSRNAEKRRSVLPRGISWSGQDRARRHALGGVTSLFLKTCSRALC